MTGLMQSDIKSLPLIYRGKVRDCYAVGEDRLLIVASDRISAFDSVFAVPVPDKGRVLTALTRFWFDLIGRDVPNQLTDTPPEEVVEPGERDQVRGRAMVVRRLKPILVECVARGYLAGSGWKDYQNSGAVCGVALPPGLRQAEKLPEPIFTPAGKAEVGVHDENISFDDVVAQYGRDIAEKLRDFTLGLYQLAAGYAAERGVIIADTKFEFGLDEEGEVRLMDEMLTPDSSRFWPADQYRVGISPPSFDKQFLRDWLEASGWDKSPPPPVPPPEIMAQTASRYREALIRITGRDLPSEPGHD